MMAAEGWEEIAAAIERWVTGMLEPSGVGARGVSA
jgi:hypothetical protein